MCQCKTRSEWMESYPGFPWLSLDAVDAVELFLRKRAWITGDEKILYAVKAGEGNMNLVIRVETDRQRFILKQSRPWVEKYDHIAAPWDRIHYELAYYERIGELDRLQVHTARLLNFDSDARVMMLEDLGKMDDVTGVYIGEKVGVDLIARLAGYIAVLHRETEGEPDKSFQNKEMRRLNHQHIYEIPLNPTNGLELEKFETGLSEMVEPLMGDGEYTVRVKETGERYLTDGRCLVHGDYFPGSWLADDMRLYVIDPEFCYWGDPEYDLGNTIAHLALANQAPELVEVFLGSYIEQGGIAIDKKWLGRYAAAEVMRRLIGVAQLPITFKAPFRCELLERVHQAMLQERVELLWKS